MTALAEELHFSMDTPYVDLPTDIQHVLLHGRGEQVVVRYRNRYGRERTYATGWEGVIPFVERRHASSESDTMRERFAGYMRDTPCPACQGARLKPLSLAVTIGGRNIAEIAALPIAECAAFLDDVELDDREAQIAERVLKEVNARLRFLIDVGFALSDPGPGGRHPGRGEAQRIRLATQIGSGTGRECCTSWTNPASACTSATITG